MNWGVKLEVWVDLSRSGFMKMPVEDLNLDRDEDYLKSLSVAVVKLFKGSSVAEEFKILIKTWNRLEIIERVKMQ